jgi:hypothetical protein
VTKEEYITLLFECISQLIMTIAICISFLVGIGAIIYLLCYMEESYSTTSVNMNMEYVKVILAPVMYVAGVLSTRMINTASKSIKDLSRKISE